MKTDRLMATYGRYSRACEALACFLSPLRADFAHLQAHPIPLRFDHPKVRAVNEKLPTGSLRHILKRMHNLEYVNAEPQ
jgi:hypothetical protein